MRVNSPYEGEQAAIYGDWLMGLKTIQLYLLVQTVNISRTPCLPFHFVLALFFTLCVPPSFRSCRSNDMESNQTSRFSGWNSVVYESLWVRSSARRPVCWTRISKGNFRFSGPAMHKLPLSQGLTAPCLWEAKNNRNFICYYQAEQCDCFSRRFKYVFFKNSLLKLYINKYKLM